MMLLSRLFAIVITLFAATHAAAESTRIIEADGTHTLAHEVVVGAPIGDVWAAISTPQGWTTWAVPLAWSDPADRDLLETSYDPAAQPGQPQTIRQLFILRIPGRLLAWRTIKAPAGFPDFDSFSRVTSIFELIPESGSRTRVRLTMTGYADDEAGRRLIGFFDRGNALSLERLRRRFSDGPIDWQRELRRTD